MAGPILHGREPETPWLDIAPLLDPAICGTWSYVRWRRIGCRVQLTGRCTSVLSITGISNTTTISIPVPPGLQPGLVSEDRAGTALTVAYQQSQQWLAGYYHEFVSTTGRDGTSRRGCVTSIPVTQTAYGNNALSYLNGSFEVPQDTAWPALPLTL